MAERLRQLCQAIGAKAAVRDCGLWLLTGQRLESRLRSVESLGLAAEAVKLVQILTGGRYAPNEKAASYDHEATVAALTEIRQLLSKDSRPSGHGRLLSM
ncbi:unnamed protein product [Effrenium voratum]|nr:unnamed protein product [Effrenium voratum]